MTSNHRFCHSLLCSSPALLLSHTPHQSYSFQLLISPAHHLQSSQYICSLTPLILSQIVFAPMPDSPALFPGLLTWYRPDLPPTIASRLCPSKPTSPLSLTTSLPAGFLFFVCLWLALGLFLLHSRIHLISFTSPAHILCSAG